MADKLRMPGPNCCKEEKNLGSYKGEEHAVRFCKKCGRTGEALK